MSNNPKPQWVRLYLAPQTDNSDMPDQVVGYLMSETPTSYVLNPLLDVMVDPDEPQLSSYVESGMNFVSKTYVWRCQVLERKPEGPEESQLTTLDGGLG